MTRHVRLTSLGAVVLSLHPVIIADGISQSTGSCVAAAAAELR